MEKLLLILIILAPFVSGIDYYVDTAGDDANSGKSENAPWKTLSRVNNADLKPGDRVLFKRGGEWRGTLLPKSGSASGYITYTSYGSGRKPRIMNSVERVSASDWQNIGGKKWRTYVPTEPGTIVFNDNITGRRKWSEGVLEKQGDWYWENGVIILFSVINPAEYYSDIEISQTGHAVYGGSNSYYIIEELELRNAAYMGWAGASAHHVIIRDCNIAYIGGGQTQVAGRLGNAIELWNEGHDLIFERNRIWEIYDAALSNQGNGISEQYNIYYRNNIIWNAEYCFEFWLRPESSKMHDIYFENNICAFSGYGFGHEQRIDPSGWHIIGWGQEADTSNLVIRNNIFYESRLCGFEAWDPDISHLSANNIDYNLYYESEGDIFCIRNRGIRISDFERYQREFNLDRHSVFADPKISWPEFRPQFDSAAIDRGTAINNPVDIEKKIRPQGSGFDIGAYEYEGSTPSEPCGNNACEPGECSTCPGDCSFAQCCPDGQCNHGETPATCPADCKVPRNWKVIYADSQETVAEDGKAENAIDQNPASIWHTHYMFSNPGHPHEIQIDLGKLHVLEGFSYLPRQDSSTNGNIKDYEFYVSQQNSSWAYPVAKGTFTGSTKKTVQFPQAIGKYIRLVALNEVYGNPWTNAAEIDVLTGYHTSDIDKNGCISQAELLQYIQDWKEVKATIKSLITAIILWKQECK